MMIIWDFGWLNPLSHARLNRMSSAPPVPPFQLPRLTECLCSLSTAVTNPSMPGMHGTQDAQANKSPGLLGLREHVKATEYSLSTANLARGHNQEWFGPLLLSADLTCVFLMCQPLHKNMSQLQTWAVTEKHQLAPCHPSRCFATECWAQYHLDVLHCFSSAPLCLPVMGRGAHWANAN